MKIQRRMGGTRNAILWLLLFEAAIIAPSHQVTGDVRSKTFHLEAIPPGSGGPIRVGEPWVGTSRASCISTCLVRYPPCVSVMYNTESGLCTPGAKLNITEASPDATEGEVYISYSCSPFPQFQLYTNGNISACIGVINLNKTYLDANLHCQSLGGSFFEGQAVEKMRLLHQVGSERVWIGLDDIQVEGKFVWRADGSVLDMTKKSDYFYGTEPTGGNEDCVFVGPDRNYLGNDASCDREMPFICEKPLQ